MWGSEPATEKQKETLKRLGIEAKPDLTKYEAAVLLDEALKKQPGAKVLELGEKPPGTKPQEESPTQKVVVDTPPSLLRPEPPPPPPEPEKKVGLPIVVYLLLSASALVLAAKFYLEFSRPPDQSEPIQPLRFSKPVKPVKVVITNTVATISNAPPSEPRIKLEEERYPNGRLKACGLLQRLPDGRWVKQGPWTNYWLNGKINSHGVYDHDKQVGAWPFWLDNGQQIATNFFKANRSP